MLLVIGWLIEFSSKVKWIEEPVAAAFPLFLLSLNSLEVALCISRSLSSLLWCLCSAVTELELRIRDGGMLSPLAHYVCLGNSKLWVL